ncbi:MAG: hypothetical protein QFE16_07820 [Pseudomonadota bacterium]|nr:hypothetical protein [Pseudomonadota bacterium]
MSLDPSARPLISAPLTHRVRADAPVPDIAEAVAATWLEIDAVLSPIIGHVGLAALYKRSLHLTARAHPWLEAVHKGLPPTMDLPRLQSVFAVQDGISAAAGGSDLFSSFYDLLAGMVGPSLTERLLRPVWAPASHSHGSTSPNSTP